MNTLGLALGISVFIALSLYVQFELSFDKFHVNADRIYRIEQLMDGGGRIERMSGTPEPLCCLKSRRPSAEVFTLYSRKGIPFALRNFFVLMQ